MGRYSAPRQVRYVVGAIVGASVFAATSAVLFNLAASAGSSPSLLSPVTSTVNGVTSGVVGTVGAAVNTLTAPAGSSCQLLCNTNPAPPAAVAAPQTPQNPLGSSLPCLSGAVCSTTNPAPSGSATASSSSPAGGSSAGQAPSQGAAPQPGAPAARGGGASEVAAPPAPTGVLTAGTLYQPPPPSITLPSAAGGINFGKAPFLWPLFLGLDVLGAGAVVLALRKTWSKPVGD